MNRFNDIDLNKEAEYKKFSSEIDRKIEAVYNRKDLTGKEKADIIAALSQEESKKFQECFPIERKIINGKVYERSPRWRRDYFTTTTPLIISKPEEQEDEEDPKLKKDNKLF